MYLISILEGAMFIFRQRNTTIEYSSSVKDKPNTNVTAGVLKISVLTEGYTFEYIILYKPKLNLTKYLSFSVKYYAFAIFNSLLLILCLNK